jgi:hypothetical protein
VYVDRKRCLPLRYPTPIPLCVCDSDSEAMQCERGEGEVEEKVSGEGQRKVSLFLLFTLSLSYRQINAWLCGYLHLSPGERRHSRINVADEETDGEDTTVRGKEILWGGDHRRVKCCLPPPPSTHTHAHTSTF